MLGPADQSGEPPLAVDQRQVAQVVAVMLDQVEGDCSRPSRMTRSVSSTRRINLSRQGQRNPLRNPQPIARFLVEQRAPSEDRLQRGISFPAKGLGSGFRGDE